MDPDARHATLTIADDTGRHVALQIGVDWYATSSDLSRAQVWLYERGEQDPGALTGT